jgi:hypothetical protein
MASWTTNPNTSQTWTSPTGGIASLGGSATTNTTTQDSYFKDGQKLYFGDDLDISMSYDNTAGHLLFHNSSGDALLTLKNNEVFTSSTDTKELAGEYMRFTSSATLGSGNLVEFRNNSSSSSWAIRHDGVMLLKQQSGTPSAVTSAIYHDGTSLYHAKQ